MLQQMRALSKSWISTIFLGGLALSFGVWGIADTFRFGGSDNNVATVGDTKIATVDFQREYRNVLRNASRREGHDISSEEAHAQGIDREILQGKIDSLADDYVAGRYGLIVSDAQVSNSIRAIPAFRGIMGTFDHNAFVQVLNQAGYTENAFIQEMRDDITRQQIVTAASDGLLVPAGYAKLYFDWLNEERAAQYVVVPAQAAGALPNPTDTELTAYLKAHAAQFSTPEYRDITYASVGPEDVTNQVHVTDIQLKQLYDQEKDQYQIPEKRAVEQIVLPDETSAKAARAKIDAGTKFEDVAAQRGEKLADIALGSVTQADLGSARGAPTFALPVGGTTQPIKFTFGWALLHVTGVTPGVNKTFDDVKDMLRKQTLQQLAIAKLGDVTNAFDDARATGDTMAEAAAKSGMRLVHIPAVDINGAAPDGSKTNLPTAPEFTAQLLKADVGEEGDPFSAQSSNHDYVIKVNGVTPPKLKPLDTIRTQVTAAWTAEQQRIRLAALAKQLAAQTDADHGLSKVAAQLHTAPQSTGALARQSTTAGLSPALLKAIFLAPPGTAVSAPAATGDAYVVAFVTGIAHPPATFGAPFYERFGQQIGTQAGTDLQTSLATAARAKLGVTINQQQFNQVVGGS